MERIVLISLIVFAIWYTMLEGEIFGVLRRLFSHLPGKLHDPVYDCPVCMCFWYGTAVYWIVWAHSWQQWLLTVIPAMGLNVVITRLWPKEEITVNNNF